MTTSVTGVLGDGELQSSLDDVVAVGPATRLASAWLEGVPERALPRSVVVDRHNVASFADGHSRPARMDFLGRRSNSSGNLPKYRPAEVAAVDVAVAVSVDDPGVLRRLVCSDGAACSVAVGSSVD